MTNERYLDGVEFELRTADKVIPIEKIHKNHLAWFIHFTGPKGDYVLTAEKEGFDLGVRNFTKSTDRMGMYELEAFYLRKEQTKQLDEVTVIATKVKMVMKGDTLVYDASAFQLSNGSMLDALVKQLPGAKLQNGQITVNGKPIKSLLVNGENFFAGSPSVALQNLPAYTVANVKVYDKEAEQAYLSKGKVKARDEENLVMDVSLKKKYNNGLFGNVDGGYGMSEDKKSRYMGKGFLIGYHEKFRLAAFANVNNVLNTDAANNDGNWQSQFGQNGELDFANGGLDYLWSKNKIKLSGNASLMSEGCDVVSRTSSRDFYSAGDIYGRTYHLNNANKLHLISNHEWSWRGDQAYVILQPNIDLFRQNFNDHRLSAKFTARPSENYRGQSLETQFLTDTTLINRTETRQSGNKGWDIYRIQASTYIPVFGGFDQLYINASGGYTSDYDHPEDQLTNRFGRKSTQWGNNWRETQRKDEAGSTTSGNISMGYVLNYAPYRDGQFLQFTYVPSVHLSSAKSDKKHTLDKWEERFDSLAPPSNHAPELLARDLLNSYNSITTTHSYRFDNGFKYEFHPQTTRRQIRVDVLVESKLVQEHLEYHREDGYSDNIQRLRPLFKPAGQVRYITNNESGRMSLDFLYQFSHSLPSLSYQLRTLNTSNPLVHYENNANLKGNLSHQFQFRISRFWNSSRRNINFSSHYNRIDRQIASARFYDRNSGVTTYRPENVDGNWNTDANFSFGIPFGPNYMFNFNSSSYGQFLNSVDYASQTAALQQSVVENTTLSQTFSLSGMIHKHQVTLSGGFAWQNSYSKQHIFNTINGFDTNATASYRIGLESGWEFNTNLNLFARAGYNDPNLNVNTWLWNASVQKAWLKGKLITRLDAVDILGQNQPITRTVNAQGITENWVSCMPRYAMLHLIYKFDLMQNK